MSAATGKLYTAEQVRRLDACAISEHGIDGYELMKRAGRAVFELAAQSYPGTGHWLVVCGAGNNGGDGYVLARQAREAGKKVTLVAMKAPQHLHGDASKAAQDWLRAGGAVQAFSAGLDPGDPDLVFDGLLGTGLDRPVTGDYRLMIDRINTMQCPVIAIDVPSGLNADTGQAMGAVVQAAITVCFIGLKQGLYTADGPDLCGQVVFNDLSVPESTYAGVDPAGTLIGDGVIAHYLPARRRNSHKGDYGHVLVVGGTPGMPGAVRLCGEAALRSGAGLVSIATHPAHAAFLNMTRPELMVHAVENPAGLAGLLDKTTVLALGPGLGQGEWSRTLFQSCVETGLPLVLDADGLNLLAEASLSRQNWVLTPHPAEAARLLGISTASVQADRIAAAKTLAERYTATVVLKGCGSVIARADGRFAICPLGNPGMATAGSGDVLTGLVAAFLGQGLGAWQAACLGVVVHACAGDLGALQKGPHGLLAGDIVELVPAILSRGFTGQG